MRSKNKQKSVMTDNTITQEVTRQSIAAAMSARKIDGVSPEVRNNALHAMAAALRKNKEEIMFRNGIDLEAGKDAGLSTTLLDRLLLDDRRVESMAKVLEEIAGLPDPLGEVIQERTIHGGARLQKVRVSLGVIGIIYESRPNVTAEAAGLCLKAGNAVILRGGQEAVNTNLEIVNVIVPAATAAGLPEGCIQFIRITDRKAVGELTQLDRLVDLIIARGSAQMVRSIREGAAVPVLGHGKGLCHTYVDAGADRDMAVKVAYNAKVQRPGVCNAMETLLVHRDVAAKVLPELAKKFASAGVELRGCAETVKIIPAAVPAKEEDWSTEYLDKILSIRVVDSLDEALNHIAKYGSGHSEAIVTEDRDNAERFLNTVDAAAVFHNSSTRLHDGGVFGLGSEIGISTQKLHARGSMGISELTTTKFVVRGTGQIR